MGITEVIIWLIGFINYLLSFTEVGFQGLRASGLQGIEASGL